jgi:DnaK suppressor protein
MTCHAARRVAEFERRLRHTRLEVDRALATADVEWASLDQEYPSAEPLDDAVRESARGLLARIAERDHGALAEIEAAEARLAAGTFGVCEDCGGPIALERLRARPTARLCLPCEAAREAPRR